MRNGWWKAAVADADEVLMARAMMMMMTRGSRRLVIMSKMMARTTTTTTAAMEVTVSVTFSSSRHCRRPRSASAASAAG